MTPRLGVYYICLHGSRKCKNSRMTQCFFLEALVCAVFFFFNLRSVKQQNLIKTERAFSWGGGTVTSHIYMVILQTPLFLSKNTAGSKIKMGCACFLQCSTVRYFEFIFWIRILNPLYNQMISVYINTDIIMTIFVKRKYF